MKIEPIIKLENSLNKNQYNKRKKMIKKRNKDFKNYLQIEIDRRNMHEEPK